MEKKVSYMIVANLTRQSKDEKSGKIVAAGWLIMKITRGWFGREHFAFIGKYSKYTDAIQALNKIYGL